MEKQIPESHIVEEQAVDLELGKQKEDVAAFVSISEKHPDHKLTPFVEGRIAEGPVAELSVQIQSVGSSLRAEVGIERTGIEEFHRIGADGVPY